MVGERDDHEDRIADAIRNLAGFGGDPAPPPELWERIAHALDDHAPTAEDVAPPPDLWDRIASEVRDLEGSPAAVADEPKPTVTLLTTPRDRRFRRILAVAAISILVIAGVAGVIVERGRGASSDVVAQAILSGKGLDPGSTGTGAARLVREDGTWEVTIRAAQLPASAAGTYYEAWLLGADDQHVQSLGSLDGSGRFAVPDGLDLADYPLVDVSIEPIDGNPAHSSRSVLRGRLEPR